jgi:hypothetical protein
MRSDPFAFRDAIRLTSPTGVAAATLREFRIGIESADPEVIHHHLRETPLRFPLQIGNYPNDFALWANVNLKNTTLAERLAVLDPFHERDIEELRERVIESIEIALDYQGNHQAVLPGHEFFFSRSFSTEIELGTIAYDLETLIDGIHSVPASSLFFHLYESRLRNEDGRDDLSRWLRSSLGAIDVAERLSDLDFYLLSLEDCRSVVVELLNDGGTVR